MSSRTSSSDPLTPQLLHQLRAQLAPAERLAWAACPEPRAFEPSTRSQLKGDALAIVGGGYALIGAGVLIYRTGHWSWLAIPISLLAFGLLTHLARRRIEARQQRALAGTVYALSTRRALIVRTYPELKIEAIAIEAIQEILVVNRHDRGAFADLQLTAAFTFQGVPEPDGARKALMQVIRDPGATDEQLAAAEAYAKAMRQLTMRPSPG